MNVYAWSGFFTEIYISGTILANYQCEIRTRDSTLVRQLGVKDSKAPGYSRWSSNCSLWNSLFLSHVKALLHPQFYLEIRFTLDIIIFHCCLFFCGIWSILTSIQGLFQTLKCTFWFFFFWPFHFQKCSFFNHNARFLCLSKRCPDMWLRNYTIY